MDTITARMTGGRTVQLPGAPTPVPGLWVAVWNGGYVIVHKPTCSRLSGGFTDPEAALAAAIALDGLTDWAAECDRMFLPTQVIHDIDAIVRRWGGSGIDYKRRAQ